MSGQEPTFDEMKNLLFDPEGVSFSTVGGKAPSARRAEKMSHTFEGGWENNDPERVWVRTLYDFYTRKKEEVDHSISVFCQKVVNNQALKVTVTANFM